MPTSSVSICSNALLILGDNPIDSFDENNDRTRLVSNLYESKRNKVLRMHPWNCNIKRVVLSPELEAPAFGWKYAFNLPGDWVRTLSVGELGNEDEYAEESGQILMDSNVCRLRYGWLNDVEATWDSLLVDVMTHVMVAAISYAITKSTTKYGTDEEVVMRMLKTARAVDGQAGTSETFGDFPLLSHRYA
jgi:hypothetical protein